MADEKRKHTRRQESQDMGGPGMGGGEKAKDFKGTLKKLVKYMGRYKLALLAVLVLAVGSTVFNIVGPKILGNATTEIFNGIVGKINGTGGIDFDAVGSILLWVLGLYLLSSILAFIQGYVMAGVSQKLAYRMRDDVSKKINRLPMKYFDSVPFGDVLSRVTNDIDTLGQSLNQSLTQLVTSVSMIVGVLVMMLTISWLMTLIIVVLLPLSGGLMMLIMKRSQRYFQQQQDTLGEVNGQVEEKFAGQNIVKAFNAEEREMEAFDKINGKLYESAWKSQFFSGLMMPLMQFVGNIGYVVVAIFGGYLAIQGAITVGNIQSFIQYVRTFTQPIAQLAQVANQMQSAAAAAERVFDMLEQPEEDQTVENPVSVENIQGHVTFDHVSFGYDPQQVIIRDFCADIRPGQKVALVGPTGAGKSTMVKLLMRFYDVTGGAILVDGHDVRDFDRGPLRQLFGMVLQETWLFHGSIRENIRYGKQDATDEQVEAAAKAAYADHFIRTLPGGYDMQLNEEASNVSQGQKQLLTIARAILADPDILVLDEATSSVDTRTELRIQKAMDNLMQGRTSFIIAHRLSTIRDADLILVMKDGDIVEQGNHEELLAQGGFYADLYNSQFEQAVAV